MIMTFKTQVPPHGAAQPIAPPAPPDDPEPNMAMLKGDIDSGRTGDKVPVFDPGMAMLGTCEEAAGTPLTPEQVKLARMEENKWRWRLGPRITSQAHDKSDRGALGGFKWSSQHGLCDWIEGTRPEPRP